MNKGLFEIAGRKCLLYTEDEPQVILIQTLGVQEHGSIDTEDEMIREKSSVPFAFAAFYIGDWEAELTPWHDPEVSKRSAVGEHARETLGYVTDSLIPYLYAQFGHVPVILGGYSLGGLFSRWAASESDRFFGVACVSPSLWIAGWQAYSGTHPVKADNVYLSLGDREEFCKDKAVSQVGNNVRDEYGYLRGLLGDGHCTLEWNPGNHFADGAARTARGFVWCMSKITG